MDTISEFPLTIVIVIWLYGRIQRKKRKYLFVFPSNILDNHISILNNILPATKSMEQTLEGFLERMIWTYKEVLEVERQKLVDANIVAMGFVKDE